MSSRKRSSRSNLHKETARPPRRTKRLKRRLVVLLLLLLTIVAAAPALVGRSGLRDNLLARALPNGYTVQSDSASLGWTSSQSLTGVKILDPEGNPLLTVESATVQRSLFALALNQLDLGIIEIVRPTAYVATRTDGSNWEDFAASLLQPSVEPQSTPEASSSSSIPTLDLELVEGTVLGWDSVTGRKWSLESANVSAELGAKMQASVSAQLATEQAPQRGQLKFRWHPKEDGEQHLELLAERLPLDPLEPWLARYVPGAQLTGGISTDATVNWRVDSQRGLQLETSGRLEASQLDLSANALTGDSLRSQQLIAPWKLTVSDNELTIEQLGISADWARLEATGNVLLTELQSLGLENLPRRPVELTGSVDIAKLARQLPRTLQLREGVRIDAGELTFIAEAQSDGERLTWLGDAELANVSGTDGQREIRWQEPIALLAKVGDTSLGPQLESLSLDAPFAQAQIQTGREAITGEFEIDLEKLSRELSQFVDVQALELRGLGEGAFSLQRQASAQFVATANVDLTDLHIADAGRTWSEPKLQIELQATGTEQNLTPRDLASGSMQLRGPRDQFDLTLLQPVDLIGAGQSGQPWQLQVAGNGPLQLWAARLRPWVSAMPQQLEGDAHIEAQVKVSNDAVQVLKSSGSVVQLRVQSDTLSIDEPRVEFSGDAAWNRATSSVQAQEMQLLGSSFSFRARDIGVATAAGAAPTARGNIAFRADLERLASVAGLVGQASATWPRGTAVGQLQLASDAQRLSADFGMQVEQLELARTTAAAGAVYGQPEIVWQEPRLEITGVANYELATDRVQLDNLQLRGQTLQLKSSASVDQVRTAGLLQASGLVEYDPRELAKLVASYAGQGVQLEGDRQVRFQIAGSLSDVTVHWSQRWNASAEAGWSSAGLVGMPLGGGRLQGTLREGQLQIAPLDVAIGQGRLTAAPRVFLTPGAEQVILPAGPLVTNVEISPEVSETLLKYVAPILAGATRAEGQFSIDLDQAELPLAQPATARVQGRLTAHRLNVSPGPMVQQLAVMVDQIEALTKRKQFLQAATAPKTKVFLTMSQQPVDFQLVGGRVYHRNLEFLVDDVPVRSYGSVGFDQTLALVLEVPIQDKWIEREPALRGFAGKSLQLPMQGTFQKPRIDQRAVADLSRQLLQGAATQAIGDELNRQFEKLLGR